jgi:hypothetical protein
VSSTVSERIVRSMSAAASSAGRARMRSRTSARRPAATIVATRSIPSSLTPSPRSIVPSIRRAPCAPATSIGVPSPGGSWKPAPSRRISDLSVTPFRGRVVTTSVAGALSCSQPRRMNIESVRRVSRRVDRAAEDPGRHLELPCRVP